MKTFFLNGKFVPERNAKINVNDLGILRGYGVFDFLRTYGKTPFYLNDHLNRFFDSARQMNLVSPYGKDDIKKIIFQLIKKNSALKAMAFRLVLTGGKPIGSRLSQKPNFFILVQPLHFYPRALYEKGANLYVLNYRRQLPEVKSLNYSFAVSRWKKIQKRGAIEVLYVFNGQVFECSSSNFFLVHNKKIYTPGDNILKGVTRKVVIGLIKRIGLALEEKNILWDDILKADEAFITSTEKEVMPVVKVDNIRIGSGRVGEISRRIMEEFKKQVKNYTETYGKRER